MVHINQLCPDLACWADFLDAYSFNFDCDPKRRSSADSLFVFRPLH
jgi:hypothetical protein